MIGRGAFTEAELERLSKYNRREIGVLFDPPQTRLWEFSGGGRPDVPDRDVDSQPAPAAATHGTAGESLPPAWASLDDDPPEQDDQEGLVQHGVEA